MEIEDAMIEQFSDKQKAVLRCMDTDKDVILAEGSIRSGKTFSMVFGFLLWVLKSEEGAAIPREYALVGRSTTTADRNIISPLKGFARTMGASIAHNRGDNYIVIQGIRFWIWGVTDKRASEKIQGATLNGALIDEIALIDEDFIKQLQARFSFDDSKLWATYNPEHPGHWLKRKYVDRIDELNGVLFQFRMGDNPSLGDKTKKRYMAQFTGHYAKRFIDGMWAAATGLVYPMIEAKEGPDETSMKFKKRVYGMDYAAAGTWAVICFELWDRTWYAMDEIYRNWREEPPMSDEEMVEHLKSWVTEKGDYSAIYIDPATHVRWKNKARGAGLKLRYPKVRQLVGIRACNSLLHQGTVQITGNCPETIAEGEGYAWDKDALARGVEEPIKERDHAMDAMRYFVAGHLWSATGVTNKPVGW